MLKFPTQKSKNKRCECKFYNNRAIIKSSQIANYRRYKMSLQVQPINEIIKDKITPSREQPSKTLKQPHTIVALYN